MFFLKRGRSAPVTAVVGYTLPKLHTGKSWYVDFCCIDPLTGTMRRKKYMLDGIKKPADRRRRGAEIVSAVTAKLRGGWNPWADASDERQYAKFRDVCGYYAAYIDKLLRSGVFKQKTAYDYHSRLGMLAEYNESRRVPIVYVYQFDLGFVSDFLDYILLDRDASARTRNNYRTWCSAFCSWLCEKRYAGENFVERIKALREGEKGRTAMSAADLRTLRGYLEETNRHFLLACMMEYYTFIRPDELSNIKVGDLHIKEQKVFVSGSISKNRRDGMVGLNGRIVRLMVDLDVFAHPGECYLFGRHFMPSAKKADSRIFRDYFAGVRAALRWPMGYQFYSLKDSGIRDLANAEGIVIARDQARHSDISTTNKYLCGQGLAVHEETKRFEGAL